MLNTGFRLMFTTKIPNVKVASATVYSNTCKNVLLIHLYRIETKKECDVSFKPSHSFTCPFAYCSAAHRNVSFIRLILFLYPFRMPFEADSLKWFTLKIRGKEF